MSHDDIVVYIWNTEDEHRLKIRNGCLRDAYQMSKQYREHIFQMFRTFPHITKRS